MEIMDFVKPEFLVIAPVLYVIGAVIKHSEKVRSNFIPLILCGVSVFLSLVYVTATAEFNTWQDAVLAVFTAITQGFLAAGAAVLVNQLIKQQTKKDD